MICNYQTTTGQDKPEMFRGLFRAAHESLLEHKPEVLLAICDADFITDSATMVQLFKVASEVYCQGPRVKTELHLDLSVQVVKGKVFMQASRPPDGGFKTDATGQFIPPRFGLCGRMKAMGAQCFKRVTAYKLRTEGQSVIPPYSILIQDDNLLEVLLPEMTRDCVALRSCQHHGAIAEHAVPVILQNNPGPLVSFPQVGSGKWWPEIMPRAYFASCDNVCLGRYGANLSKGFWEYLIYRGASRVFREAWAKQYSGELWSLANLLQWIHIKAQGYASTGGRDTQFRIQLKATSFEQHGGVSIPVYDLVTESLYTLERLVSEKDVDTFCRWMTEPGWRSPSAEQPPPYAPVAHPPPAHAD